jgi:sulfocyanin
MKRFSVLALLGALAACGGGEPAQDAPAAAVEAAPATPTFGEMTTPEWFHVDEANRTVHMTITAGLTDALNYWNFNGAVNGSMAITVPEGYTVTVDLVNKDPVMAHSLVVLAQTDNFAAPGNTPAFEGAATSNPTSMTDATMPGETESITFTASAAGNYSMVCLIPGHSAVGMWIYFNVSADGSMGVQTR